MEKHKYYYALITNNELDDTAVVSKANFGELRALYTIAERLERIAELLDLLATIEYNNPSRI